MEWVRVSTNVMDLTGEGLEYLLGSDGLPVARFQDGNLILTPPIIDSLEVTKNVA